MGKPVINGDPGSHQKIFASIPARHQTLTGGTNGVLHFTPIGISYITSRNRGARNWLTGGLILQWLLGYLFSAAVWVGYIDLFGIAVETGVVMVVYLHEALDRRLAAGTPLSDEDIEAATIEGAVLRLRPKLMTVACVIVLRATASC